MGQIRESTLKEGPVCIKRKACERRAGYGDDTQTWLTNASKQFQICILEVPFESCEQKDDCTAPQAQRTTSFPLGTTCA